MYFSLRRFRAILLKEYRHILRAPRTLLLVLLAPAFLLLLLANIFAVEAQQARIGVWDLDNSIHSRRYIAAITADGDFTVVRNIRNYEEIGEELRSEHADFVLIIPYGFGRRLIVGASAEIEAIFDATDAIRTPQLQGYLMARSSFFSGDILLKGRDIQNTPLELRSVKWYNPAMQSRVGMIPGLTPIVLSMPALAYGLSIARERELGSFEGLITTPVQGAEYLFGKSIAYITLGLLSVLFTWLVSVLGFQVPFRGSLVLYFAMAALYLAATIGLVTAAMPILKTQQIAFFIVLAYFFVPSFFTSGLLMPVLSTGWDRISSDIFPATHFVTIARSIFVKGLNFYALIRPALFLFGMYLGGMILALLTFRKRLV